jgi:hypothetical protein
MSYRTLGKNRNSNLSARIGYDTLWRAHFEKDFLQDQVNKLNYHEDDSGGEKVGEGNPPSRTACTARVSVTRYAEVYWWSLRGV